MDSVRYYVALILMIAAAPALTFWVVIHPFIRFWRRLGAGWTLTLVWGLQAVGMVGLFLVRKPLLATEFGTSYPFVVVGVVCLAVSVLFRVRLTGQLTPGIVAGLPELSPDRHPGTLLTDGAYSRMRHPRYAQVLLALLGYALFANYLALYVVVALWVVGLYPIILLEERELRDRFGAEYESYCRRVPRFIPKLGGRSND
jgi:protein-S-isoprenylcysteine O-methyltransferase Ste14